QGSAVDVLHRQEVRLSSVLDRIDGDDVRVIERGHGLRLALEALAAIGLRGERRRKNFDRDGPLEASVLGEIHLAHAAAAERLRDPVMIQNGSDHERAVGLYARYRGKSAFVSRRISRTAWRSAAVTRAVPKARGASLDSTSTIRA